MKSFTTTFWKKSDPCTKGVFLPGDIKEKQKISFPLQNLVRAKPNSFSLCENSKKPATALNVPVFKKIHAVIGKHYSFVFATILQIRNQLNKYNSSISVFRKKKRFQIRQETKRIIFLQVLLATCLYICLTL